MNDQNLNENNIDKTENIGGADETPKAEAPAENPFAPALDLTSDPKKPVHESSTEQQASPAFEVTPEQPVTEDAAEQVSPAPEPIFEYGPGPASAPGFDGAPGNPAGGFTPPEPPKFTPPEKVYIGVPEEKPKPEKKPKAKLSLGAAAILILICIALSGGAAFGGTLLADRYIKNNTDSNVSSNPSSAKPSVIFRDLEERNEEPGTYAQVAERVSPAVVEIVTESLVTDSYFWGSYVTSGAGSGVIISEDGKIITNNHVVSGARNVRVRLSDGSEYDAEVIGTDSDTDIAVIQIDGENLPFAVLGNSDEIRVGEEILAVGNPLGELGGTVTNGIVSALSRNVTIDGTEMTLIQMNAAVNPGNSGGGLFNLYGELIGIVNAKTTSSSSGISVEGIGFAIPINTVSEVVEEIVNYGYVRGKAMLGINYVDITTSYEAMMNRVSALGVYVTASEQPGLKSGDRIVAIDGEEVMYSSDIKSVLTGKSVGDTVEVTVVRNGKYVTVDVTLLERKPEGIEDTYDDDDYSDADDRDDDYEDDGSDNRDDYYDDERDAFSKFFEESFRNWFS